MTQPERNPYPYTDSNKRYMTYDWYLKARFGGKAARVALDQGCTCPNIDGTRGIGGCLFCKNGSASAFRFMPYVMYLSGLVGLESITFSGLAICDLFIRPD